MKHYLNITRQTVFNYLSILFINIIGIFLISLLTRNLSIVDYGAYSLFTVLIVVFPLVLNLGLDQFVITKLAGASKSKRGKFFFSLFVFELVFLLVLLLVFFVPSFQLWILNLIKLQQYLFEFKIALLIIFLLSLVRLMASFYISQKKLEFTIFLNTVKETLWVILLFSFFFITKSFSLHIAMSVWLVGIVCTFLIYLFSFNKDLFKLSIYKTPISRGLHFGLPLIPFLFGTYIISLGDRYVINFLQGTSQVGIYALAYTLTGAVYTFGAIIANIMRPYISESWNKKSDHNTLLNMSLKYTLLLVIPALVGFFILRSQIITLISGVKYAPSIPLINVLIFYPLFAALIIVFYQYLLLTNRTTLTGVIYLIGATLNIILNLLLIPIYGLFGAAIATIITYFLIFITIFLLVKKHISINFNFLKLGRIVFASAFMGVIVFFFDPQILVTKILVILFGVGFYFLQLLVYNTFSRQELVVFKKSLSLFSTRFK